MHVANDPPLPGPFFIPEPRITLSHTPAYRRPPSWSSHLVAWLPRGSTKPLKFSALLARV